MATVTLFLYPVEMKERLWVAYYWLMILILIIGIGRAITFAEAVNSNEVNYWMQTTAFPDFPFLLTFVVMTVIRWIAIGKHFWNKP